MARSAAPEVETAVLENEDLLVTTVPWAGASIHAIEHRASGVDLLFETPWGLRAAERQPPAPNAAAAFANRYGGGWQALLPSAGGPCEHAGATHVYHGEAASTAWTWSALSESEIRFEVRLCHTPLRVVRLLTLGPGPVVTLDETVTNEGGEPVDYMWSHHPAFGPPFLGPGLEIDIPAGWVEADAEFDGPFNPLRPGARGEWASAVGADGGSVDLRQLPADGSPRHLLAYVGDLDEGRFTLANRALGLAATLRWDRSAFPYAWLWQELHASSGYPWYRGVDALAIEPATAIGAGGIAGAVERGSHRVLDQGESASARLSLTVHDPGVVPPTGPSIS